MNKELKTKWVAIGQPNSGRTTLIYHLCKNLQPSNDKITEYDLKKSKIDGVADNNQLIRYYLQVLQSPFLSSSNYYFPHIIAFIDLSLFILLLLSINNEEINVINNN